VTVDRQAPGDRSYVALCGGVGGAKLALGLSRVLPADRLTIIVNTGDDFEHLGLHISPDIDTVLYTLAGVSNQQTGWGLADETWSFMTALRRLGGPSWFQLGDADLATHVLRTRRLNSGDPLTQITQDLARSLGVSLPVLPMSDQAVRTRVDTEDGPLAFQEYFVARRCTPVVTRISFELADSAQATPGVRAALAATDLGGIIICPSNPWLSIDPILAVPGMVEGIRSSGVPVVAVTPLIAGRAVKGPTDKIMSELGIALSVTSIIDHYGDILDGFILDEADAAEVDRIDVPVAVAQTLMQSLDDRIALAESAIELCRRLGDVEDRTLEKRR